MESTVYSNPGFDQKYSYTIDKHQKQASTENFKKSQTLIRVTYVKNIDSQNVYRSVNIIERKNRDLYRKINQRIGG